jgi:hypothetical protein
MKWAAAALALVVSTPVLAQVNYRPTDPPIVTADNDQWYRLGEPIVFSGEFYYPTGPVVFFNGDVMVRTGHYNGVPIYTDTTLEPYSILLVPIGRGQMQPYERVREGDLAGTSGSRPSSFPGRTSRMPPSIPVEAIGSYTLEAGAVATTGRLDQFESAESSILPEPPRKAGRPFSYNNVSVQFMGEKWVMAGPSGPLRPGLIQFAEYKGFPVYAEKGSERTRIYVPITPERFAPFKPAN